VTEIIDEWWFNCKVEGTGALLQSLEADDPFASNVADSHPRLVEELFGQARADAGGASPAG
jgi:hypothetical protein